MVDPNTRQGKRTPVTLKIKFKSETLEQFIERYAVDVSQGGIFIRTKEPLAVGTQMKFEFQLRDASPLIAGEGTVVWTRENDPSRPAIAPGMGVRFDRLADGSQGILERILAEKAKQAPQRPVADSTKPPLFTDTPTRVAPAPVQEALLGRDSGQRRREDGGSDSLTPLPKPIPFHSDADEFPDEAFEEATKVRSLDELIAQTADGSSETDELAARRPNGRSDATQADPAERAATMPHDMHEAPNLPNPPEPMLRPQARMLDTTPSPRIDSLPPLVSPSSAAKTQLGMEPARARVASSMPPMSPFAASGPGSSMAGPMSGQPLMDDSMMDEGPMPSAMRAVASEPTQPARMPPVRSRSAAPFLIVLLLLVAAGGAAVWFFVLRPRQLAENQQAVTTDGSATPGSAIAPSAGSGSDVAGSAAGSAAAATPAPPAQLADTMITASAVGATVEIVGANQSGSAPFTAKLETGKAYKARITAPGYAALEVDLKGGGEKISATLVSKPRVLAIDSDPSGAMILVDGSTTGHTTPFEIELTSAQAAKKSVRVQLKKAGYRTFDRNIDLGKMTEEASRMIGKVNEQLSRPQPQVAPPPPPPTAPTPPPTTGPITTPNPDGTDAGSGSTTPSNGTTPSAPTPDAAPSAPAPTTPSASGSAAEPTPEFTKQP